MPRSPFIFDREIESEALFMAQMSEEELNSLREISAKLKKLVAKKEINQKKFNEIKMNLSQFNTQNKDIEEIIQLVDAKIKELESTPQPSRTSVVSVEPGQTPDCVRQLYETEAGSPNVSLGSSPFIAMPSPGISPIPANKKEKREEKQDVQKKQKKLGCCLVS